jgi:translation initiation factor 2 beta subunit (eIF-2beta)/eIF-5
MNKKRKQTLKNNITKESLTNKSTKLNDEYLNCPECGETLIEKFSGVKCSKCDYWDCF